MIKAVVSLFIILTAVSTGSWINISVAKSQFLFFKWANFMTSLYGPNTAPKLALPASQQDKTPATTTPQSDEPWDKVRIVTNPVDKWYVFADYYGKIQAGTIGITAQYKLNLAPEYVAVPLTKDATSIETLLQFLVPTDVLSPCVNPDTAKMTAERAELVENTFNVYISITCEVPPAAKTIVGPVEHGQQGPTPTGSKPVLAGQTESQKNTPATEGSKKNVPAIEGSKKNVPAIEDSKKNVPAIEGSKKLLAASKQVSQANQVIAESQQIKIVL